MAKNQQNRLTGKREMKLTNLELISSGPKAAIITSGSRDQNGSNQGLTIIILIIFWLAHSGQPNNKKSRRDKTIRKITILLLLCVCRGSTKVNCYAWFVSHNPCFMAWWDHSCISWTKLSFVSVIHSNIHSSRNHICCMVYQATICLCYWFC